jgi:signal transduction histidine kinase
LVSLLKLTLKDNPDLLIIEEQTSYLNNTITDFNSFSTSSVQEKSYFDLKKSIEVTLNIFEFQAKSSKIDIRLDIEETATIQGNIGKFNQAFLVLLSNAKDALIDDHTKTERIINISTKTNHNDEIILTISDNGGGIALEIIDKIFEPYFTTKFKDKGTGIGLSMTYNIIQKMNGKIEVNNNKEGAVFTIILPKFKPKENTYAN